MSTTQGIARLSNLFKEAYDKPISESGCDLWLRIFRRISDADLERAAVHLIEHREKGSKVNPGEITRALEFHGIYVDPPEQTKDFRDDPMVRALESRYRAEEEEEGISLHEWLKQEGLSSFREAMEKYADHGLPSMPGEPLLKEVE